VFFIATPGASSAHLTISEIFPSVLKLIFFYNFIFLANLFLKHMRSQALAIFFSIGEGVGGALAPTIFGILISEKNRYSVFIGYIICNILHFTIYEKDII